MHRPARTTRLIVGAGSLAGLVLSAAPAGAHVGAGADGAVSGLLHPFLGLDHVFAMVTVGVLAAVLARPILVPAAFVAAMVVGGALGMAGLPLPAGEVAIAASVVALGAAIVVGAAMRWEAAVGLVALAGFVHGHAHGVEAPSAAHPVVYVAGFVLATTLLHAAGVGVGMAVRGRIAVRAGLGAAVVGVGLGLVAGVV